MSTTDDAEFIVGQLTQTQTVANVSLVDDKKIIRIAVSSGAKAAIERWRTEQDMTEIGVASRVYEWFGQQSEEVQRAILGMYGSITPDVAKLILERMASAGERPKKRGGVLEKGGQLPQERERKAS